MSPKLRKVCKYCRWKRCLNAGMSFDLIKMGRISREKVYQIKLSNLSPDELLFSPLKNMCLDFYNEKKLNIKSSAKMH